MTCKIKKLVDMLTHGIKTELATEVSKTDE